MHLTLLTGIAAGCLPVSFSHLPGCVHTAVANLICTELCSPLRDRLSPSCLCYFGVCCGDILTIVSFWELAHESLPIPLMFLFNFVLRREKTLRNISLTYQQFQNSNENLMFWMNNLPKHQVKTTDGPSQINYKLQAQKVSFRASLMTCKATAMGKLACEHYAK